jgi:ribokinase
MTIFNLGSCCIDHVYQVPHFAQPGETLPCLSYEMHPGGKGLNQSLAMARAGADVFHAGKIGSEGTWLKELLAADGVDTSQLRVSDNPTGHACIQVNAAGENSIVLFGGTNRQITVDEISAMLAPAVTGDFLVLQNEISELETAIQIGATKGMRIVFNAAPMTDDVAALPLASLELLIINEIEGAALSSKQSPDAIMTALGHRYPDMNVVLTLGSQGARLCGPAGDCAAASPRVDVVDSTGAGDTFTGYFVADYAAGRNVADALLFACQAAALSVTQRGAASSIPTRDRVEAAGF